MYLWDIYITSFMIPPICQQDLTINVCICLKVTAPIGSKTAFCELFSFFWYNEICLSNFLYKKTASLSLFSKWHNGEMLREKTAKWMVKYYFMIEILFEWLHKWFFILSVIQKSKQFLFNPEKTRIVMWQPNDKLNKLLYLEKFNWYDNEILISNIFPETANVKW